MLSAKFRANSTGNNVIVAGVNGKKIEIYGLFLQASVVSTVVLRSGTSSSGDFTGPMTYSVGGGLNVPISTNVLWTTAAGEGFNLNLSGLLADVGGCVFYEVVDA